MERTDSPEAPRLKPGRGRRRAEEVRRATLAAAADLLLSDGIRSVTFEKVATRAGVSKMTLYKWWASPGALALEAYFSAVETTLAFPDTGDVRADLSAQLRAFVGLLDRVGATFAELIGAAQSDRDLSAALSDQYVVPRRRLAVKRMAAAQEAGQIREDVDLETIVDQLWGACYHRLLLPAEPLSTGFTDTLVANLFDGITPAKNSATHRDAPDQNGAHPTSRTPAPEPSPRHHNRFENPPPLPHDVVLEVLDRALDDRSQESAAAEALVGVALNDDDREFVEHCCLEVGARAPGGSSLLGLAGLCLGHAARRFGYISDQAVALAETLATRARLDPSDVDGRALDGIEDIRFHTRSGESAAEER